MYDKQKVIDWALGECGYHEGPNNWNKYAEYLDGIPGFYNGVKQNNPYCDVFVDAGFVHCYGVVGAKELLCQPDNSCGAGCAFSAGYFRQHGRFHETGPQPGDQIFFSYRAGEVSHTGLVVEVTRNTVVTVEGNTSDMVAKRTYALSEKTIYGYGRPDWGAGGTDEGQGEIVLPDEPEPAADLPTKGLPLLRFGSKGESVVAMQGILIARKCSCGPWGADGDFGKDTEAALLAFQRRNGLAADAKCGPVTWAKLLGVT